MFIQFFKITTKSPPVLYISNHSSWKDVIVFNYLFPNIKILAAKQVLSVPIIGWFMKKYLNCYAVNPGSTINEAVEILNNGSSIIICPEGWAYLHGEMQHFKTGAAVIASKAKVPIIPIYIKYSKYHSKQYCKLPFALQCILDVPFTLIHKVTAAVIIGKPIPYSKQLYKDINKATTILEHKVLNIKYLA